MGDFWKACTEDTGLHVTPKNAKVRKLELTAHINYPLQDEDHIDSVNLDSDPEVSLMLLQSDFIKIYISGPSLSRQPSLLKEQGLQQKGSARLIKTPHLVAMRVPNQLSVSLTISFHNLPLIPHKLIRSTD